MSEFRVVHVTLEKCGSQWVRDALTAPEVVAYSNAAYSGISFNLGTRARLELPANAVSGPIYNMNQWEWAHWRRAGDRAIVVLRDPRDVVISLLFSLLYSHGPDPATEFGRSQLAARVHDEELTDRMIEAFGAAPRMFLTWTDVDDASALVVRFEELVADQFSAFRRIYDWLGWPVPADVLELVVTRLDFRNRSGRDPGTLDPFSHYRKGIVGDWRGYFTRRHGEHWEGAYPGLLRNTGYESSDDWWRTLPERTAASASPVAQAAESDSTNLEERAVAALKKRNAFLEREVEEKQGVIVELHTHYAQRADALLALDAERERLLAVCAERLQAIDALTEALVAFRARDAG